MLDPQRTPEWFSQRIGKVTASRIADVLATTRSGPAKTRADYKAELVAERLTGERVDSYVNAAMQRGTDLEPLARDAYAFATDQSVEQVGFIAHPTIEWAGCSPDGLVGDDGLVEIKCVNRAKHIDLLLGAKPEGRYVQQVTWQMACTGRLWCDLAYYSDAMPVEMQLHIVRIDRDEEAIATMEEAVSAFLAEVAASVEQLTTLYRKAA